MTNVMTSEAMGHEWTVRPFRPDDAEHLARIYRAAVRVLAARYYTPEQIAAWMSIAPAPEAIAAVYGDGRTALVSMRDGLPVAFSDHDATGHIRFLYCDPTCAGRGTADHLMNAIETSARDQGISFLSSEASEAALGIFQRHGFQKIARRDFEVSGVTIHNYAVEKRLAAQSPMNSSRRPMP